jgi:hypothetical protein
VLIDTLPAAAPADSAIGMLEGWEDRIEAVGDALEWTMTLTLSPPRLSGYGLTWAQLAPALTWATADPLATFEDTEYLEAA